MSFLLRFPLSPLFSFVAPSPPFFRDNGSAYFLEARTRPSLFHRLWYFPLYFFLLFPRPFHSWRGAGTQVALRELEEEGETDE